MTSYLHRPCWKVPLERRCEALAKPTDSWTMWNRYERRCQRPAEQSRDARVVCWQHAQLPLIKYCEVERSAMRVWEA